MKATSKMKILATLLCTISVLIPCVAMAANHSIALQSDKKIVSSSDRVPFSEDDIQIRYKTINGKMHYRHFHSSRNKWVERSWQLL